MIQKKRAFSGLAGSPLARAGRPRIHNNNAAKQKAYRQNKANKLNEAIQRTDLGLEFLQEYSYSEFEYERMIIVLDSLRTADNTALIDALLKEVEDSEAEDAEKEATELDKEDRAVEESYSTFGKNTARDMVRGKYIRNAPQGKGLPLPITAVTDIAGTLGLVERRDKIRLPKSWAISEHKVEQIIEGLVVEHFQNEGDTTYSEQAHKWSTALRCQIEGCGFIGAWGTAKHHLTTAHEKLVRDAIRPNVPRQWKGCSTADHISTLARLKKAGKTGPFTCGRCRCELDPRLVLTVKVENAV